jgi:hypothetical protein
VVAVVELVLLIYQPQEALALSSFATQAHLLMRQAYQTAQRQLLTATQFTHSFLLAQLHSKEQK